jgi:hypothetical protein
MTAEVLVTALLASLYLVRLINRYRQGTASFYLRNYVIVTWLYNRPDIAVVYTAILTIASSIPLALNWQNSAVVFVALVIFDFVLKLTAFIKVQRRLTKP